MTPETARIAPRPASPRRRARWGAALALAVAAGALAGDAAAVTTRVWTTATYKEFDEGEADGAAITSNGEVVPGLTTERVALETDAIWSAVRAPDGTIYAGAVSDGKVLAVSGGKVRVLASLDAETPWIGALALGRDGTLYAGTIGSGAVHAIDTANGKVTKLVTLEGAEHVWALALDAAEKTLYAGTGSEGKLFAIDLGRKAAKSVWQADDKHLLSLARAADGALWIGTSEEALLYRFDPTSGEARAIADFAGSEVKAIAVVDGGVVVAANEYDAKASAPPAPAPPKGPKGTAAKPPEAGTPGASPPKAPAAAALPRPGERKGKGALFRVEPDGRTEQLHALADAYFQAIAVGPDGSLYAGAGAQGRVYQVRPDRTIVTLFDVEERQVNAILAGKEGVAFATGDAGALYVAGGAARTAHYQTKVFDAQFPARWGNLAWRAEGELLVETRSGNTAKPGRGWSAWQRTAAAARAGGGATAGRVASPPGRYLQVRATWQNGKGGALRELKLHYLPQNQRPRVTDATIGETGDASKRAPVTTATGAAKPRSPVLKLKWKTENPDDDELVYTLEARADGAVEWTALPTGPDPLTKTEWEWNTEMLPDGYYRLRVTASDGRANPRDLALAHAYVSPPFLIDNLKPQVTGLAVAGGAASGVAVDSFSRIDEIAWAIDGGEWRIAFPRDNLFDDLSETFTIKLPADLVAGPHTLSVRVADEADNVGAASVTFRVAR